MARKGSGKSDREGISLVREDVSRRGTGMVRIEGRTARSACGSVNVQSRHRSMTHRCRDDRPMFSLKTGNIGVKAGILGLSPW